ncbi:MAG: PD-(D/E)XK nuclease family protein [bacterium]|nr:PD-(D/E)XK nuclease family protein [bacterium]
MSENQLEPEKISRLLNEVAFKTATLAEARKRFSAQLAPEFSIFDFLRTDETGLSSCIASLLDPKGTHGQGSGFLEAFIAGLNAPAGLDINAKDCRVQTEKQANGQRRIDIHLEMTGCVIGIENKPWAGDQDRQLSDYAAYLKNNAANRHWMLVYLCNSDPAENSISKDELKALEAGKNYFRMDYWDLIKWLDGCAGKSRSLVVRVFIEELANFIRIKVNGEPDMSEAIELKNIILSSNENLDAAFHIAGSMTLVKNGLLEEFRDALKAELDVRDLILVWEETLSASGKACAGFGVKFNAGHRFHLRFEFSYTGLNGLEWGICRNNKTVTCDQQRWGDIKERMDSHIRPGKASDWWPWYVVDLSDDLASSLRDWGNSSTAWVMIRDKSDAGLVQRICKIVDRVREALSGTGDVLA